MKSERSGLGGAALFITAAVPTTCPAPRWTSCFQLPGVNESAGVARSEKLAALKAGHSFI